MAQDLLVQLLKIKEIMAPSLIEKLLELSREEAARREKAKNEKKSQTESNHRPSREKIPEELVQKVKVSDLVPDLLTDTQYLFWDHIGCPWIGQVRSFSLPTYEEMKWYIQKNPLMKDLPFWIRNEDVMKFYSQKYTEYQYYQYAYVLPVLHLDQPLQNQKGENPSEPVTLTMINGITLIPGPDPLTYIAQKAEAKLTGMDYCPICDAVKYYLDGLLYDQYLDGLFEIKLWKERKDK